MGIKLLLVSPMPPPVGGIATWTSNILRYYSEKEDSTIEVSHLNTSIGTFSITNENKFKRWVRGIIISLKIYINLILKILNFRPDLVHVTSSGSLALFKDILLVATCRIFRIKAIIHFRFGRIPNVINNPSVERVLILIVLRLASHIIVLDSRSLKKIKSAGFHSCSMIGNPIPMDLERFIKSTPRDGCNATISDNPLGNIMSESKTCPKAGRRAKGLIRVVFIGHIKANKGVFELVKALQNTFGKYRIEFAGPSEEQTKKSLVDLSHKLQVDSCFHGVLKREQVFDLLSKASVLALPSYTEGFPNVVLEALSFGCPVVATDVGAIPDIVSEDNKTGITVEPRDPHLLRSALFSITQNTERNELFGERGKEFVWSRYSKDVIYAQYERLWFEIIGN